jgi:hypothetical protein
VVQQHLAEHHSEPACAHTGTFSAPEFGSKVCEAAEYHLQPAE